MGLNKQQRLRGASEVSSVITGIRPISYGGLSLRVLQNRPGERTKFSVVVPVGVHAGAVKRNTLRRRIAESLRVVLRRYAPTTGRSVVLMAKQQDMSSQEIEEALVLLLGKSGILQQ
jgi:ribonuclease P protein component